MPSSVATIGVLAMAIGILNLILGALIGVSLSGSSDTVPNAIIVVLLMSAAMTGIGYGLLKGMRWAWFSAMGFFGFELITRLGSLFGTKVLTWELLWGYVWTGELGRPVAPAVLGSAGEYLYFVVAIAIVSVFLYALFRPNALEYFRKERETVEPTVDFSPPEGSKT